MAAVILRESGESRWGGNDKCFKFSDSLASSLVFMNTRNMTHPISKGFHLLTEAMTWAGYVTLAASVVIVLIDVSGRYFFNRPLKGAYDLILLAMPVLVGSAIMYAAIKRGHVAIDLLLSRFSRHTLKIMQVIISLLGFGTWAVLAYKVYQHALNAMGSTPTLAVLPLKEGPFLLALAVGTSLCSLTLLIQAFHPEVEEKPQTKDDL